MPRYMEHESAMHSLILALKFGHLTEFKNEGVYYGSKEKSN